MLKAGLGCEMGRFDGLGFVIEIGLILSEKFNLDKNRIYFYYLSSNNFLKSSLFGRIVKYLLAYIYLLSFGKVIFTNVSLLSLQKIIPTAGFSSSNFSFLSK